LGVFYSGSERVVNAGLFFNFVHFAHGFNEQKALNDHQCTFPSKYFVNFPLTISCALDSSLSSHIYLTINTQTQRGENNESK